MLGEFKIAARHGDHCGTDSNLIEAEKFELGIIERRNDDVHCDDAKMERCRPKRRDRQ